jgi:hypothetical protein
MSDVKTVNISREAAALFAGGVAKKGRRSTKKNQSGGAGEELRGVSPVMNVVKGVDSSSSVAATAASPNSKTWLKYPAGAPVPPRILPAPSLTPLTPVAAAAPTSQQGGTKHIKVELRKKTTAKKVHLNPKKTDGPKQASKKHHTRKHRKITIGLKGLHKRITRAKTLHKNAKEMPLDKLKEKLVKGGLIKPTSKAPEHVLRQIAGDAEVVAKKAL